MYLASHVTSPSGASRLLLGVSTALAVAFSTPAAGRAAVGTAIKPVAYHGARPMTTIPIKLPENLVFDSAGNLYVANRGTGQVLEYDTHLQQLPNPISLTNPSRLAIDAFNNLFVANTDAGGTNNFITEFAAGTAVKTLAVPTTPFGLAVDAYDDILMSGDKIYVYNQDGLLADTYTGDKSGNQFVGGSLLASGQNLYVATGPGTSGAIIGTYNVGNFLTGDPHETSSLPAGSYRSPTQEVIFRGALFVSDLSGVVREFQNGSVVLTISGLNLPTGVAVGRSGNIYVSEHNTNQVGIFSPSGHFLRYL